jgi:molybdate transport repressor ModE-like protein/molybdopterin-binding protein
MNEYLATILPVDAHEGYLWLHIGKGRLACPGAPGLAAGQRIEVRVPPTDVLLAAEEPVRISARNILKGRVTTLKTVPEGVYVGLNVGFVLYSLVTEQAADDLGIRKGKTLYAIIKANSVEIKAHVEVPVRVSVKGANGYVESKHIDLLRAIENNGSLTMAAKSLGITYRSAWMWADAMNQIWKNPLLQMAHGGKGGGGALLTPEGQALLKYVARIEESTLR